MTAEDLREALARVINPRAFDHSTSAYYGPDQFLQAYGAAQRVALKTADALIAGPLADHLRRAEAEAASWRRVAERLEEEKATERARLAALIRELAATSPVTKARPAFLLAANLVARGRHLTDTEKLQNLVNGMADYDRDLADSIAERAGLTVKAQEPQL